MEGNAQAKFQDQRNVIWFTNYLPIYFQSVNRIEYESVWLRLIFFLLYFAGDDGMYIFYSRADDRNHSICNWASSRKMFFCIHILISICMPYATSLGNLLKCVTIIFKSLATRGIQLTRKILCEETKTSTLKILQAWRTVNKNV